MDKISIKDLEIFAHHGVFREENILGQKFLVSVDLFLSLREAGRSDNLECTVNYGEVCHKIKAYLESRTEKLLEKAAEGLAEELLLTQPLLQKVRIELKKPWAPIGLPLKTASVELSRGWHKAYIAMGSNLGDKKGHLDRAVEALRERKGFRVGKVSNYIKTAPYGVLEQPEFLNACLELDTLYTPRELLDILHELEDEALRERTFRWGPRTLDLDIIFYDDLVMESANLCIPHLDMHNRAFVLGPLLELCSYKRHPVYKKTIKELYDELDEREGREKK